ncbi:MAG: bifunctional 2-polyprenyl-6-hydroxyphenol methylase/3-demethylubiquinol 3-O-methyltransferase UbiG [Dokdonella sp.]
MMHSNVDPAEVAKFDRLASRWWDTDGESRPLHDLNPVRMRYIASQATLHGASALDVGCGGGLLSEALAAAGARVTAIDLSPAVLDVARLHLLESGLEVDYRQISAEDMAPEATARFDVITCMEMLEHVPDPASVIRACADMLKPGGKLFLSTLNRTSQAFAAAIVGAEYVLRLLPRGTHRYAQFIKPSELVSDLRAVGLVSEDVRGIGYNPFTRRAWLLDSVAVNYLVFARKPE